MSIQPALTPAQQTVRDLIQAWRDESGIPVSQPDCHGFGAPTGRIAAYRGSKTAPADAPTSVGPGPRHDSLGGRRD